MGIAETYTAVFNEDKMREFQQQGSLGQWLKERCKEGHLSLRQAAAKTGLSHSTICDIMNGARPSAATIVKLAEGFGGDGINERLVLEDHFLILAGYRTPRPQEELSEALAQLMDRVKGLSESQIKMMSRFADFLIEIEGGD